MAPRGRVTLAERRHVHLVGPDVVGHGLVEQPFPEKLSETLQGVEVVVNGVPPDGLQERRDRSKLDPRARRPYAHAYASASAA